MADVVWSVEAKADRDAIWYYIAEENPIAAVKMDGLFSQAADRLGMFTMLGRVGKIPGTREFIPHPSYRLVYEIAGDRILILALVHVARQWPPANE